MRSSGKELRIFCLKSQYFISYGIRYNCTRIREKTLLMKRYIVFMTACLLSVISLNTLPVAALAGQEEAFYEIEAVPFGDFLFVGDTVQLEYVITPDDGSYTGGITWTSNSEAASVDDTGRVTGISQGMAVINAELADGSKTAWMIYVVPCIENVSFKDNREYRFSDELIDGLAIDAFNYLDVVPSTVSSNMFAWSSSDPEVIEVISPGRLRVLKAGSSVITVTALNDPAVTASQEFTVYESRMPQEMNVTGLRDSYSIYYYYSEIQTEYKPEQAASETKWSISDPETVRLYTDPLDSQKGNLFAKKTGTVELTIANKQYPDIKKVFTITSTDEILPYEAYITDLTFYDYDMTEMTVSGPQYNPEEFRMERGLTYVVFIEYKGNDYIPSEAGAIRDKNVFFEQNPGLAEVGLGVEFPKQPDADYSMYNSLPIAFRTDQTGVSELLLNGKKVRMVVAGGWQNNENGWWYDNGDGTFPKSTFQTISGKTYYFDANGYMVREWIEVEGDWYYMGTDGVMVKDQAVGDYYVKEDGRMAKNEEIKGVYYGADGKRVITDDPNLANVIVQAAFPAVHIGDTLALPADITVPATAGYMTPEQHQSIDPEWSTSDINGRLYFGTVDAPEESVTGTEVLKAGDRYFYVLTVYAKDGYTFTDKTKVVFNNQTAQKKKLYADGKVLAFYVQYGPLKHDLVLVPGIEATCTEEGIETHYKCAVCKKTYLDPQGTEEMTTAVIPPLGHTPLDKWGYDTAGHYHKCELCGEIIETTRQPHVWSDWKMDESHEMMVRTCTVCRKKEIREDVTGIWKQNSTGWWYEYPDGSYAQDEIKTIDGKTYYFNRSGYMVTGWAQIEGKWYLFDSSGAMKKNAWEGNYWLGADGVMATSSWVDNNKYYVGPDGKWIPDYGVAKWKQDANGWWYSDGYGGYPKNCRMTIDGKEYYFKADGYIAFGWQLLNGKWYVFDSSGAMKKNAWEGNYWLGADGAMATSSWVDNNKYYVGPDGLWIEGYGTGQWKQDASGWWYSDGYGGFPSSQFKTIDGIDYYFKADGYMAVGWLEVSGAWYFFDTSGAMKKNAWQGNYWLKENGKMATSEWVDGGRYYVDASGAWVPNAVKPSEDSHTQTQDPHPDDDALDADNNPFGN